MKRRRTSLAPGTSGRRLELIFYRGTAKTATLRRIFGIESSDALWAGLYLESTPEETLSMDREILEALTPPYTSISFALPTNDYVEHRVAKAALDAAGIRYEEPGNAKPGVRGGKNLSRECCWLCGSTLNRDIYRLVFEVMYGFPTLISHRFIFTISTPMIDPGLDSEMREGFSTSSRGSCIVSTYYWRGLQLVSRGLAEEAVELLARSVALRFNVSFEVRNR